MRHLSVYRLSLCLLALALSLLSTEPAKALDLDPKLHGLCTDCDGQWPVPNQAAFNSLTQAYGLALAPIELSPTNTIGINAVEVDFSFAFANLSEDASTWVDAINAQTPPSQLTSTRFTLRKGLPYSFELQGQLAYLLNSELWTVGAGAKWALNEAVRAFPIDLSLRAQANRVVGNTQLDLSMVSYGVALGTQFGILGMVNLAPFVTYQPVMIFAGSSTLDATPGAYAAPGAESEAGMSSLGSTAFVFARTTETVHRASAGFRFMFGVLKITPEFMWTPHQTNINISLGFNL